MQDQIRILLIQDSEKHRDVIIKELSNLFSGSKIDVAESYSYLKKIYKLSYYDVIICDFKLSDFKGVDVLFYIRERDLNVPFIFISDTEWEDSIIDTLVLNGATDYVLKVSTRPTTYWF